MRVVAIICYLEQPGQNKYIYKRFSVGDVTHLVQLKTMGFVGHAGGTNFVSKTFLFFND